MENIVELKEDNLELNDIEEILKEGCDLRQYSKEIERQLKDVENQSIQDYMKESQNIVGLHKQIAACDDILERMEKMLVGFQSDLGSISSEILYLQRKSITMSQQLHNRQAVRGQLTQFIDDMAVPESLIMAILERPVTDSEFSTQLSVLNHKINFVSDQTASGAKCCQDVKDVLQNLKLKAVTKIRAYLLEQVSKFRKPMANYQVPQNAMLKYRQYFEFTLHHERVVAQEVCNEYIDTMGKIYFSYFKSYLSALNKLVFEEQATKDDLMGSEETGSRGLFHKASLKQKNTVFTIGNRGDVLTSQFEAPIIIPHSAGKAQQRYPYEALFRSLQYALVDNACREFFFISEFFCVKNAQAIEVFAQIMGRTLGLLVKSVESYVGTCYDGLALFLCAHLVLRYQLLCHKRAVPALDTYWDKLQEIIWPRFELVLKMNIQSVKDCDPLKFAKDMNPHYITRRFAEFSSALISISESFPNELVSRLVGELFEEVELLLLRLAAMYSERLKQLVLLMNNYEMALSVVLERCREGCREAERLRSKMNASTQEYLEEVLSPHIGSIIQFVREGEEAIEKGDQRTLKLLQEKEMSLVEWFSNTWKDSVESLSKEVICSFPSLVLGCQLQQMALASLLQYYERFHKLLSPPARAALVNIHHIKVQLKKHKVSL